LLSKFNDVTVGVNETKMISRLKHATRIETTEHRLMKDTHWQKPHNEALSCSRGKNNNEELTPQRRTFTVSIPC
jgi:hypothetical protein